MKPVVHEIKCKEVLVKLKEGLLRIYGPRLKGVYLYGSYARQEQHRESDLDVLIVLDQFADCYGAEIDRTGYLASDLSLKYGVSISRVFVTERDWQTRHTSFLDNVREEAIAA